MSEIFTTPKCNIIFPKIEEKVSFNGGKAYYSVQIIIDKSEDMKAVKKAVADVAKWKWGIPASKLDRTPIRDGDTIQDKKGKPKAEKYPFYKNRWVITAKSTTKPRVIGADKRPLENSEVTQGSECYVSLHAFAWEYMGDKGVSIQLHNIQKLSDGDLPETEPTKPEDEFGVVDMPAPESGLELFEENDLGL